MIVRDCHCFDYFVCRTSAGNPDGLGVEEVRFFLLFFLLFFFLLLIGSEFGNWEIVERYGKTNEERFREISKENTNYHSKLLDYYPSVCFFLVSFSLFFNSFLFESFEF